MEPHNIFNTIFSLENPAIYGFVIVSLIFIIMVLIKRQYIKPLNKRKLELEIENTKLMALFAEIDPEPILRVNNSQIIISANNSALNYFKGKNIIGSEFSKVIPNIDINDPKLLDDDEIIRLNEYYFNISVRKIESLGFFQIYLHDITKRIEYEKEIEQYQKNLRSLRTRLEKYNEDEKQRLGKELHDSIGQNISLLKIELQKYISVKDNQISKNSYVKLLQQLDDLSNNVREISHQLRPRILNEFGLFAALSSVIDSINIHTDMKGSLFTYDNELQLPNEFELNVYRICQEALNNIVKHSKCKNFYLQFITQENFLRIIISDDGVGLDVQKYMTNGTSSLGLLNLRERVNNYSGEINIESNPNEGTTLFIKFPAFLKEQI